MVIVMQKWLNIDKVVFIILSMILLGNVDGQQSVWSIDLLSIDALLSVIEFALLSFQVMEY